MGGQGSGRHRTKQQSEKKDKEFNAVSWLEKHPEDIPMARENLKARDRGFANDDIRQLMAAVCLKACTDYKYAISRKVAGTNCGKKMINDCRKFFESDIFQFFVNGMSVDEIEKCIKATPKDSIKHIWKRIENNQRAKSV